MVYTAPDGLRLLADWFDAKNPDDPMPEVQTDLRKWADELEQAQARVKRLEGALLDCCVTNEDAHMTGWYKNAKPKVWRYRRR